MTGDVGRNGWGSDDQVGAGNHLTSELVLDALKLAKEGRIFELSFPITMDAPRHPVYLTPYYICLPSTPWMDEKYHRDVVGADNGVGFVQERVELDMHTGTHIDALGHTTVRGAGYNGFQADEMCAIRGLAKLGIEHLPPIITRGVLIDVPACLGRQLDVGEAITVEDLKRTLEWEGVTLRPGDFAFVRSDWARFYEVDNDRYSGGWPGIGIEAARWLADQGVVGVGADQMGVEVWPSEDPKDPFPVHIALMVEYGVYLLEQAQLDELSAERVYEFTLLCLAPKWVGATGSPVRLIAIT